MADIATTITSNGEGDWTVQAPALQSGNDLATAFLISFFTDRQANADDALPSGGTDRRGWWGNAAMGSRLWLLERAKQTDETLKLAEEYATEALAWMLTDAVASSINVAAEWNATGFLALTATINRTDGSTVVISYAWAWDTSGTVIDVTPGTVVQLGSTPPGTLDFTDPAESGLLGAI